MYLVILHRQDMQAVHEHRYKPDAVAEYFRHRHDRNTLRVELAELSRQHDQTLASWERKAGRER